MIGDRLFRVRVSISCFVVALFLIFSCAGKSAPEGASKSVWTFDPEGIQIHYTADKLLNLQDNESHTLLLAVYLLRDTNAFNDLAANRDGLAKLLQAERFDAAVMGVNKIVIQPGEEKTAVLNRAENARWIGVVAGYYNLEPSQVSRLFNIPVITEKKGIYGFRSTETRPGQIRIKLYLGSNALHELEVEVK